MFDEPGKQHEFNNEQLLGEQTKLEEGQEGAQVDGLMTFEEYAEVQEKAEIEYEEISESGKRVVYFGADHSNDPDHSMFGREQIERKMEKARPDVVFVEGLGSLLGSKASKERFLNQLRTMSKEAVIQQFGESGFTAKLAIELGAEVVSPEPKATDEIEHLCTKGSRDEVFAFYISRQILDFQRSTAELSMASFREYIQPTLEEFE